MSHYQTWIYYERYLRNEAVREHLLHCHCNPLSKAGRIGPAIQEWTRVLTRAWKANLAHYYICAINCNHLAELFTILFWYSYNLHYVCMLQVYHRTGFDCKLWVCFEHTKIWTQYMCCTLLVRCYGAYHDNAINKFAICLENLETQGIYYTIKTSLWYTPYIDMANHTFSV